MFEDLEKAKEALRKIDEYLTLSNDDAVREMVKRAIALIDHYENARREVKA
jgi:selenocysteine lyase/cysteine desulfurase